MELLTNLVGYCNTLSFSSCNTVLLYTICLNRDRPALPSLLCAPIAFVDNTTYCLLVFGDSVAMVGYFGIIEKKTSLGLALENTPWGTIPTENRLENTEVERDSISPSALKPAHRLQKWLEVISAVHQLRAALV